MSHVTTTSNTIQSVQNGPYKLEGGLGVGGMAAVYLGFAIMLKVRRAIKVLNAAYSQNNKIRDRFLQEAQTMARWRHRNIATVFDVGMDGGTPFIAMELLEGGSFQHYTERMGSFSPPLAAKLMRGILKRLQEVDDAKIVDRDIKLHNPRGSRLRRSLPVAWVRTLIPQRGFQLQVDKIAAQVIVEIFGVDINHLYPTHADCVPAVDVAPHIRRHLFAV